jgi:hypothetical protein
MSEVNNSFQFSASKEILDQFLKHIHSTSLKNADIDNYSEEFYKENIVYISFDSFGQPKQFITKMKTVAKKFGVNFDCTIIIGWDLYGDYLLFTYRHLSNKLKCYELLPEHKELVKQLEDETYEFQGKTYDDSDIPGMLGEDMIEFFYGDSIDKLVD